MEHFVEFPKLGLSFTVKEDAFLIGNFAIKWYGVLIGLGFVLAILYAFHYAKKMKLDEDSLLDVIIFGMIAGIIGARLFYVVFYPGDKYWKNPGQIFDIRDGGLGFYGGLIGALVCAFIVAKIKKMNIPALFDLIALGFLIGQSFGRWGNFTNQEAFGGPTDLPWGMQSDNTRMLFDSPVHPCFLYESLLCVLGFIILHFFTQKWRRYDGQTFLLYLIWYGVSRFFIESTRSDSLMIGPIKISMLVAVLFVVSASILLIIFRNRTVLSGVGSAKVLNAAAEEEEEDGYSTIFTDKKLSELYPNETPENDDEDHENDDSEPESELDAGEEDSDDNTENRPDDE